MRAAIITDCFNTIRTGFWQLVGFFNSLDAFGKCFVSIFLIVVGVEAVRFVVSIFLPGKSKEGTIIRKYIRTNTHYQNGMVTGVTKEYYMTILMTDGKKKTFRVFRNVYDQYLTGQSGVVFYKGIFLKKFHVLSSFINT